MKKLELVSKVSTTTSRGMLSKAWYTNGESFYLVKGNSIDKHGTIGYEPISEAVASRIGEFLGMDVVRYEVADASMFPEVETYSYPYVSICKKYDIDGQSLSMYRYLKAFHKMGNSDFWTACMQHCPNRINMFRMLALDAAIGNMDRHVNNWDIIITSDGQHVDAPVLDFGASLLAWCDDATIMKSWKIGPDASKPFKTTHTDQMSLIKRQIGDTPLFRNIELEEYLNFLNKECSLLLGMLPEKRAQKVLKYLIERYSYLRMVM